MVHIGTNESTDTTDPTYRMLRELVFGAKLEMTSRHIEALCQIERRGFARPTRKVAWKRARQAAFEFFDRKVAEIRCANSHPEQQMLVDRALRERFPDYEERRASAFE